MSKIDDETKKLRRIQVPSYLIIDRDFPHDAFALYVELKIKSFNNRVSIYPIQLKNSLNWTDNRKLKRHLKVLFDYGLIDQEITRITNSIPISLAIKDMVDGKNFTQVDIKTIDKVKKYTTDIMITGKNTPQNIYEVGIRLFYYYEKNYNEDYGKAFPTYEQITKDTKIHSTYIKAINSVYDKHDIVKVRIGEYYMKEIDNELMVQRAGNQYIPMCTRY